VDGGEEGQQGTVGGEGGAAAAQMYMPSRAREMATTCGRNWAATNWKVERTPPPSGQGKWVWLWPALAAAERRLRVEEQQGTRAAAQQGGGTAQAPDVIEGETQQGRGGGQQVAWAYDMRSILSLIPVLVRLQPHFLQQGAGSLTRRRTSRKWPTTRVRTSDSST